MSHCSLISFPILDFGGEGMELVVLRFTRIRFWLRSITVVATMNISISFDNKTPTGEKVVRVHEKNYFFLDDDHIPE